jgi:hypothetical protein
MSVNVKIITFWDTKPCNLIDRHPDCWATCCLHLQKKKHFLSWKWRLWILAKLSYLSSYTMSHSRRPEFNFTRNGMSVAEYKNGWLYIVLKLMAFWLPPWQYYKYQLIKATFFDSTWLAKRERQVTPKLSWWEFPASNSSHRQKRSRARVVTMYEQLQRPYKTRK